MISANSNFDVLIIGGGVAGLSCAFELIHENNRRFLLLDQRKELGGQLEEIIFKIRDFGTFFADGPSLQKGMVALAKQIEIPYRAETEVLSFNLAEKSVNTAAGSFSAKTIVLATGSRVRQLDAALVKGSTNRIFYWREGHEVQLEGKKVAIIGAGDYALGEALALAKTNAKILLICRSSNLHARHDLTNSISQEENIDVLFNQEIVAVKGLEASVSLDLTDQECGQSRSEEVDAVLVKIGNRPNSELFQGQLKTDQEGFVCVDKYMHTSLDGVFAIGDLTDGRWLRLATAQGEGVMAAHSALKFLAMEWHRGN